MSAEDPFGWVGATIADKVRVERVVAEGGFAVVYRGRHEGLGEPVAIKCLRIPDAMPADERERFRQSFLDEGRLLYKLSRAHDAIVLALDVGTASSPNGSWTPYLVLEWLAGRSLRDEIDERRKRNLPPYSLAEAVALLDPVAGALDAAHRQGVAHRDIKPGNLMFAGANGNNRLKLCDFGIAKVLKDVPAADAMQQTGPSIKAFTPQYGAPEQFDRRRGATGPWTDVYALALVLVELCTGREALDGDDVVQLMVATTDRTSRPTLHARGHLAAPEIDAVIEKALAVDPRDRFAAAGEFWAALRKVAPPPPEEREPTIETAPPAPTAAGATQVDSRPPFSAPAGSTPITAPSSADGGTVVLEPRDSRPAALQAPNPTAVTITPAPATATPAPATSGTARAPGIAPVSLTPNPATFLPVPRNSLARTRRGGGRRTIALALAAAAAATGLVLLLARWQASDEDETSAQPRVHAALPPTALPPTASAAARAILSPATAAKVAPDLAPTAQSSPPSAGKPLVPASGKPPQKPPVDRSALSRCLGPSGTLDDCQAASNACAAAGDLECVAQVSARLIELTPPLIPLPPAAASSTP